ncbi:reverse transcriptase domain-containing protein [Tanacetum coccineum]
MIQQVQQSCQYHGLPGDDANKHIDKFLTVTQSMKHNRVPHDVPHLCLFPYSLAHHATAWFDRLPKNFIHSWEEMVTKFLSKYFRPSMVTKLRNDISNFRQLPDESLFEAWERYKLSIDRCPNHNMLPVTQIDTFYNGLTLRHRDTINAAAGGAFMKWRPEECYDLIENMTAHHNDWDTSAQRGESSRSTTSSTLEIAALKETGALPSNTILNPREDIKVITTQSGITLAGPSVTSPNPSSYSSSKEVERDPKMTMDQPPIPYPSRLNKEKLQDKSDIQITKFSEIFKKLHFNINLVDALAHMPKYDKMLKNLLTNKEKLIELARELEVDKFTFLANLVIVDYDADHRVPLILGRPFLRMPRALVDVYGEELTLRVGDKKLTFNVESASKYPPKHGDESINQIDIIDTTCEDHFHEVLNVQKLIHPLSGSPTPSFGPVVTSLSTSLTSFGNSDFLLEESDAFLSLDD